MSRLRHSARRVAAAVLALFAVSILADAETILLPHGLPTFNQNYTDGLNAWGSCALGTGGCPDRISTTGCLVTAFASVLAYYQIEVTVPASVSCTGRARSGMDPGILNDWLQAHGGYGRCSSDPIGSCCLVWDRLPDGVELTFHANRSDAGLNPISSVVIDHALRSGWPVVAGVHWSAFCRPGTTQSEDCHWVVVMGKIGDTYTIMDPMNPDPANSQGVRTTLNAGTRGAYTIDRFVVVAPTSDISAQEPSTEQPTQPRVADEAPGGASALALLGVLGALIAIILLATRRD